MSARMQIVLGKGQHGVPLAVLSKMVEETEEFLRSLGSDLGDHGDWLAHNFRDGSVIFDLERPTDSETVADLWRRGLDSVIGGSHEDEEMEVMVSRATREKFQRVTLAIPENQSIEFGVFRNGESNPSRFHTHIHHENIAVAHELEAPQPYFGEVQGVVHAFYKESHPRKLVIREIATERLIKCEFPDEMYESAVEVMQDKDAVIFVEGDVRENSLGRIISIAATDFSPAPAFDEQWMESRIGDFPNSLSGDLTPAQALDFYRSSE